MAISFNFTRQNQPPPTFHEKHRQACIDSGMPTEAAGAGMLALLLIGSFMLTIASVSQNAALALGIAQTFVPSFILVLLLVGCNLLEIAMPTLIRKAWRAQKYMLAIAIGLCTLMAASVSFVAGVSFNASTVENAQSERVNSSPEAIANADAQQALRDELAVIAIAPDAVQAAKSEIERLEGLRLKVLNQNAVYMNADYTPKGLWGKKTKRIIREELTPLDDLIAVQTEVLRKSDVYQAKRYQLQQLQHDAPSINSGAGELAGFKNLATFFDSDPQTVRTNVLTRLSVITLILAALGWYIFNLFTEKKVLTHDELMLAQGQLHAMRDLEQKVQIIEAEAEECELQKTLSTPDDMKTLQAEEAEKRVGESYPCPDCEGDFVCKSLVKIRCSDCAKVARREAARRSRQTRKLTRAESSHEELSEA